VIINSLLNDHSFIDTNFPSLYLGIKVVAVISRNTS